MNVTCKYRPSSKEKHFHIGKVYVASTNLIGSTMKLSKKRTRRRAINLSAWLSSFKLVRHQAWLYTKVSHGFWALSHSGLEWRYTANHLTVPTHVPVIDRLIATLLSTSGVALFACSLLLSKESEAEKEEIGEREGGEEKLEINYLTISLNPYSQRRFLYFIRYWFTIKQKRK